MEHGLHENGLSPFFPHIRTMADRCKNIKEATGAYSFRTNIEFGIEDAYANLQTYRYLFLIGLKILFMHINRICMFLQLLIITLVLRGYNRKNIVNNFLLKIKKFRMLTRILVIV